MLAQLPASVARPAYDRGAVHSGIVHLGVGAFHCAHQPIDTEAVLQAGAWCMDRAVVLRRRVT